MTFKALSYHISSGVILGGERAEQNVNYVLHSKPFSSPLPGDTQPNVNDNQLSSRKTCSPF